MTQRIEGGVTVTASSKQTALQLTCALIASGNVITTDHPQDAAEEAVRLLQHVQAALRPTRRPGQSAG